MRSGAIAASSRASTATLSTACARRSSRSASRTSCASCCAGSTSRPARSRGQARPARGCRPAPGFRHTRRRLGAPHPAGACRGLQGLLARRAVHLRRRHLGAARPAARTVATNLDAWLRRTPRRRSRWPGASTCRWLVAGDPQRRFDRRPREAGAGREILDLLSAQGALFYDDIVEGSGRLPTDVERGLWDLVARGLATADGFQALRSLMASTKKRNFRRPQRARLFRTLSVSWHPLRPLVAAPDAWRQLLPRCRTGRWTEALAEAWAEQLLFRYGVVFRDLTQRENVHRPLARDPARTPPHGGAGPRARRPLRRRLLRRAVRAPRGRRIPPQGPRAPRRRASSSASAPSTRSTSPASSSPASAFPPSTRMLSSTAMVSQSTPRKWRRSRSASRPPGASATTAHPELVEGPSRRSH